MRNAPLTDDAAAARRESLTRLMETPDRTPSPAESDAASRDAVQDALRGLSEELLAPAMVLQAFAPRLVDTVERGDSSALVVIAELIERNAANLEAVLKSWERFPSKAAPAAAWSSSGGDTPGELWQIVLHELRTPVAAVQGSASTLKTAVDFMDSEGLARMAGAIERGAARLGELVESFGHIDALARDEMKLQYFDVELGGLVHQIVKDLEPVTNPHPVSVVVDGEVPASVDPLRLRQVITNLLSNAAKFSKPATPIRVDVGRSGERVTVAVLDEGPGIPSDRAGELFKRFSRLDARVSGMGLGLYVSRAIARAHGGDITLMAPPAGGACFVLSLPPSRGAV